MVEWQSPSFYLTYMNICGEWKGGGGINGEVGRPGGREGDCIEKSGGKRA